MHNSYCSDAKYQYGDGRSSVKVRVGQRCVMILCISAILSG